MALLLLPRHALRGGARARREDEVVVFQGALRAVGGLDGCCFGGGVEIGCRGEDELEGVLWVGGEAGLDGVEELIFGDEARYDGADGGDVPVEVGALGSVACC